MPRQHGGEGYQKSLAMMILATSAGLVALGLPRTSLGESPPGPSPALSGAPAAPASDAGASSAPSSGAPSSSTPSPRAEPDTHVVAAGPVHVGQCREQEAQPFMVRGNWFPSAPSKEELVKAKAMQEHAVKYRTEQYGYFEGFGQRDWNPHPPAHYARGTKFMGLPVEVHEKILPALACVEHALHENPVLMAYHPEALSGLRRKNTYRGGEVSNHVYGIAVDVDPHKNTCCGCVAPWNKNPLCTRPAATPYERMAMPKGWVDTFERYGFYWLGHDVLRDTMHFEFLGDPERIAK